MRKKQLFNLMILVVTVITFASCGKTNTQGKLIPKEAAIVIHLDGKSLTSKLSWDEIKQNPLFTTAYSDSALPLYIKNLLDNPENSGIDIKTDMLFFIQKDSLGAYIAFQGSVKDEKAFKAFNKQMTENGTETELEGVQYISKSPLCVGWTKEKFTYIFDAPQAAQMDELSRRMMNDSIDISSRKTRDLGAACKNIFALKESNTLAKDEKFTEMIKEAGDVHFWMNAEQLNKGGASASVSALALLNMDKLLKGYITAVTINFENGKMLGKAKTYAGEEISDLFKKYSGGKINEDMIKRLPATNPVAVIALNFKPEGLRELIKLTNLDGLVNIGLTSLGFTMDDFIKANKGDIVISVSDIQMKQDTTKYNFNDQQQIPSAFPKPSFNFIFAASIADKDAFNKLIGAGKKMGQAQMGDTATAPFAYRSNGTYFTLGNTMENVDKYLGTTNTNFDFISKINGEPFGGFINIQSILKTFENEASKDSSGKIMYDASVKMWDNTIWKGGNFENGGITQSFEVNLVDKTTNSLKQLNQYVAKLSGLYKEKQRKMKEASMAFQDLQLTEEPVTSPPAE